jgi:hypothetical protein
MLFPESDHEAMPYRKGGKVKKSKPAVNSNKNSNKNHVNVIIHNHQKTARRKSKSLAQQTNNLKQQATVRPFQPIIGYMGNPSPNNFNLQDLVSKLELLKEKGKVPDTQEVRPEHLNINNEAENETVSSSSSSSSSSSAFPQTPSGAGGRQGPSSPDLPQAGAQPVTAKNPTIRDQVVTLLLESGLHDMINNDAKQSISATRFDQWYSSHRAVFDGRSQPATTTATKFSRILQHQDYVRGLHHQPASASISASAHDQDEEVGRVSKPKKLQFGGTV